MFTELERGGDGGQLLHRHELLLGHRLEVVDGAVHDGGELRRQRGQDLGDQRVLGQGEAHYTKTTCPASRLTWSTVFFLSRVVVVCWLPPAELLENLLAAAPTPEEVEVEEVTLLEAEEGAGADLLSTV